MKTSLWRLLVVVAVLAAAPAAARAQQEARSDDFDFEFGEWTARVSRLVEPLSGSTKWVDYVGTSVVHKLWDGRGNIGELDVTGETGRIQGLSLRLYNPETGQWFISWANSRDGQLGPPMIGGFEDGVGTFYNQEMFNGRAVYVRFIFSDIRENSFRFEQAFSIDGGTTWEPNWIATFERTSR